MIHRFRRFTPKAFQNFSLGLPQPQECRSFFETKTLKAFANPGLSTPNVLFNSDPGRHNPEPKTTSTLKALANTLKGDLNVPITS